MSKKTAEDLAERDHALVRAYKANPSPKTERQLIEHFRTFVKKNVFLEYKKLAPWTILEEEDFINSANLALLGSAQRFDETQGARFRTFALLRLRGQIIDDFRNHHIDGVARHANALTAEWTKFKTVAEAEHGPLNKGQLKREFLQKSDKSSARLQKDSDILMLNESGQIWARYGSLEELGHHSVLASAAHDPARLLEQKQTSQLFVATINKAIENLNPKERDVVEKNVMQGINLTEIAEEMNITLSAVSLIRKKAFARLERAVRIAGLYGLDPDDLPMVTVSSTLNDEMMGPKLK